MLQKPINKFLTMHSQIKNNKIMFIIFSFMQTYLLTLLFVFVMDQFRFVKRIAACDDATSWCNVDP